MAHIRTQRPRAQVGGDDAHIVTYTLVLLVIHTYTPVVMLTNTLVLLVMHTTH